MLFAVGPEADMTAHPDSTIARLAAPIILTAICVVFIIVQPGLTIINAPHDGRRAKGADLWLNQAKGSRTANRNSCHLLLMQQAAGR